MCAQHPVTLPVKNRPQDDYLLVETCSLHITYLLHGAESFLSS